MLEVRNLGVRYGARAILDGVSFTLSEGQWLMVIGPNGAGKSTLISAISRGVRYTGTVLVGGRDAKSMRPAELARRVGALAQHHAVGYAFTVEEIVRLGRYAHASGWPPSAHEDDQRMVDAALEQSGMLELRDRSVLTLSGGETQRAFLAQVWAQNPGALLLDEPSNHLDLAYQQQTFERIKEWLRTPGRAVLSVVHDLSLARAYGTDALLLSGGRSVGCGKVREVLTRDALRSVYDIDVFGWMRDMLAQWGE